MLDDISYLDEDYNKLHIIHSKSYPHTNIFEFMKIFENWIRDYKEVNPFTLTHENIMNLLEEFKTSYKDYRVGRFKNSG